MRAWYRPGAPGGCPAPESRRFRPVRCSRASPTMDSTDSFTLVRVLFCAHALAIGVAAVGAAVGAFRARAEGAPGNGPYVLALGIGISAVTVFLFLVVDLFLFEALGRSVVGPLTSFVFLFDILATVITGAGLFLLKAPAGGEPGS